MATIATLTLLAAPATAQAHIRSGVVATDYRASVLRVPRDAAGAVSVRIYRGDRAVGLTVAPGHLVSVLGPSGSRMLQIDERHRAGSRSVVWHDPRLRRLPPGVERARWQLPLTVDGTRTRIDGTLWRLPAPVPWPWLLAGLPFLLATGWVLRGSRRKLPELARVFAGLAAFATLLLAVGFAASRSASLGRMLEGFDEIVFGGVAVYFLVRGAAEQRMLAALALGFLALFAGGLKVAALDHALVLSALPAAVARATIAFALWSGVAAIIAAGWVLASSSPWSASLDRPMPR
jgi:hypothetical protein